MHIHPGRGLAVLSVTLFAVGAQGSRAAGQEPFRSRCGAGAHAGVRSGWVWLPQGEVFCPLAADPKQGRSYMTYLRGDFAGIGNPEPGRKTNIASVGFGDGFGIFRIAGAASGDGLQLDLAGAVFSQANLDAPSFELINADYLIGLPLTFRASRFSGRLRVYHQSSHLGDEFILHRQPERVNFSFESIELILSREAGALRVYGGVESLFRREPSEAPSLLAHGGVEIRPTLFSEGRLLAAVDLRVVNDEDLNRAWSVRAGLEIARIPYPGHPPRVIAFVGEYYHGVAPYGQFYREHIRFWGFGFQLNR